jgi:glycosyl transferase family 87
MKNPTRLLLILVCSIAIGLLGLLFIRNLIDFPVYYAAGQSLISGRTDLYSPDFALGRVMDYRYPPFFLIALTPLWFLPYTLAAYVWYLLSVLEIIGCVLIVVRVFPSFRESWMLRVVVALGVIQYFVMALHYGNAHLLATFLLFASLYYVLQQKDLPAAALMALAITIKLTPVLLLPYFALKRRWTFLGSVCAFLIAFDLAPSIYFGFRGNSELVQSWYGHVVASQEFHEDNGPINLSLKGQLRRYLSTVDYSQRVDGDVQYPAINLASLSRQQVDGVWAVIAVGLFAGVLFLVWRGGGSSQAGVQQEDFDRAGFSAHELSLMLCLMLLVGPLTSKIYFIALFWPLACLASFAVDRKAGEGKLAMRVLVVVALVNSVLPLLPGRSVQRLLLVLGVDFYLNCLLMVALMFALVSRQRVLRKRSAEPRMQVLSEAKTP